MKKTIIFLLTIVTLTSLLSCEKDPPVPAIIIGNSELMDVSYYGHLVKFAKYGEEHSLQLDVNDDGTDDLVFNVMASDSLGNHDKRGSTVSVSNNKLEICMMASTEDLYRVRSYNNDITLE